MKRRSMSDKSVQILLVEDDEIDAEAIVRAFKKQEIANPFTIVTDGIEALDILRGEAGHPRLSQPYLILLDINMPRMNGIEFLKVLRQDAELRQSIVFVLTTSNGEADKTAAYDEQVAGYLLKSNTDRDFSDIVTLFTSYERVVEFPPKAQSSSAFFI
jgi:CheY-like chemotaxis protein